MRRISKKLFLVFSAFFMLFGHAAQACRGYNEEQSVFFEKMTQEQYENILHVAAITEIVVENMIETTGPTIHAYAKVLSVLKGEPSLNHQTVIVSFKQTSCGPYLKKGDKGIVYARTVEPYPFNSLHEEVLVLDLIAHKSSSNPQAKQSKSKSH